MPKFAFKLQPLLDARLQAEEQAQQALASLLREKLQIEGELQRHQTAVANDKRTLGDALVGRVDLQRIRGHAAQVNRATLAAQQSAMRLVELNRRIERARAELAEATRQRKAIEVLRDRRLNRWRREQDRRETAALDELAVQRRPRRREEVVA